MVAAVDAVPAVLFELRDEIRPEARAVMSFLQDCMGLPVHMVTGDNTAVAQNIAVAVNIPIENVTANALPWQKVISFSLLNL